MSDRLVIEENTPFKESIIWSLQEEAYKKFGPEAWAKKGVPFYLTSNPLIASQFASIIVKWLSDTSSFDFTHPIYIFDLGAGSGRLAFLLLKELLPVLPTHIKIRYVMTDIVVSNVEAWRRHALLKPFLDSGVLDFALYHHQNQEPIKLLVRDETLGITQNPLAIIATYFFDTIPQTLYRKQHEKVELGYVNLSVPVNCPKDDWIMNLEAFYSYRGLKENPPFISNYSKTIGDCSFLIPEGAFTALDYFSKMSNKRLLVLAGDQGLASRKQVEDEGEPVISKHASFSIPVNYDAMKSYFMNQGGSAYLPSFPNRTFVTMAALLGNDQVGLKEMFQDTLDFFGAADYWELTNVDPLQFSLEQLLILLKLGHCDPVNMHAFFTAVRKKLPSASKEIKESLFHIILKCLENAFPISPEEGDFYLNMGVLLYDLHKYSEALTAFEQAEKLKGGDPNLFLNQALCRKALGKGF